MGLNMLGQIGSPTRKLTSSLTGFTTGFPPALSPGVLARPDGVGDGVGATEALSGRAGAFASDSAFAASDFSMPVSGLVAVRAGSEGGTGVCKGVWVGAFAGAEAVFAVACSFGDSV